VDFPAPLTPRKAKSSPSRTQKLMPSTAFTSPKLLERSFISIIFFTLYLLISSVATVALFYSKAKNFAIDFAYSVVFASYSPSESHRAAA
jgi:hypothetical protein